MPCSRAHDRDDQTPPLDTIGSLHPWVNFYSQTMQVWTKLSTHLALLFAIERALRPFPIPAEFLDYLNQRHFQVPIKSGRS